LKEQKMTIAIVFCKAHVFSDDCEASLVLHDG